MRSNSPLRRAPLLYWRERRLLGAVFGAFVLIGLSASFAAGAPLGATEIVAGALAAALFLAIVLHYPARRVWHAWANARATKYHLVLGRPVVIDGDTIHDAADGTRYRLANIDAPELGDGAKCAIEGQRAELARLAVIAMVNKAEIVSVRRTWRIDRFGRRVAFAYADGVDIGEALVAKGFARPWRGMREKWCGPRGGLMKIAETRAMPISCKQCGAWSAT